jgi:hypothetical protein
MPGRIDWRAGRTEEEHEAMSKVEPYHRVTTRVGTVPGLERPVRWGLALVGTGTMFVLHAPALLCFAAATGLAVWWCRELDGESP